MKVGINFYSSLLVSKRSFILIIGMEFIYLNKFISLCLIYNIIKYLNPPKVPSFGIFAEDGLFDVLSESNLQIIYPKVKCLKIKMLWLFFIYESTY